MSIVVELRSPDELTGLDDVWDSLLSRMPNSSFFQSIAWLRAYWQHFGDQRSLRVMLVGDRESIHGILPLEVRLVTTPSGPMRILEFAGSERHGWGGPIGPHPGMTMSAVAKFLRKKCNDWDIVRLRAIDWDGDRLKTISRSCQVIGQRLNVSPWTQLHELQIPTEASPIQLRGRQALRTPAMRAGGQVEYQRFRPDSETDSTDTGWEVVELCNAVLEKNAADQDDGDDRERLFFEDVHVDAVRLGLVDIGTLTIDGEPVAFHYGYVRNECVDELVTACPAPVRATLMQRLVADSIKRGDQLYRFTTGASAPIATRSKTRSIYAIESVSPARRPGAQTIAGARHGVAKPTHSRD